MNRTIEKIKKNMTLTRIAVLATFATNTLTNILLIGFLARMGGLELVGVWALLSAITAAALIFDFGITNALAYRIGRDGIIASVALIRYLNYLTVRSVFFLLILAVVSLFLGYYFTTSIVLTTAAALLQILANWYCAIRIGRHEYHWLNVQTMLRVIIQALTSILLVLGLPSNPELAFSLAMLIGSLGAVLLSWLLVRSDLKSNTEIGNWSKLRQLNLDFGIEAIASRAFYPLSQLAVSQFLGGAALGIFTVALRIPVVVNQSLSEALRVLLPGIAETIRNKDEQGTMDLLRDALVLQLVLVVPIMVFFATHSRTLMILWIGGEVTELSTALRVLSCSMAAVTIAAPFYWLLMSTGQVRVVALSAVVRLLAVLALGSLMIVLGGTVLMFIYVFAAGQIVDAMLITVAAERSKGYFRRCLRQIRLLRVICFLGFAILLNAAIKVLNLGESREASFFALASFLNIAIIGSSGIFLLRRRLLLWRLEL